MNRHAKAIIGLIIAVAFILPMALVVIGGIADNGGTPTPTTQAQSPEDMDFTKLSRADRKRILDSVPNKEKLTDAQKKEFLDTGRITMTAQPSSGTPSPAPLPDDSSGTPTPSGS